MALMIGNKNANTLAGTTLADFMFGLAGDDTIDGAAGNDVIIAGLGNDNVSAGAGNDIVDGGDGNDIVDGGSGNDVVAGGAGLDTIGGGADNDTITGGAGADLLDGGDGLDTAVYLTSGAAVAVDLAAGTGVGGEAAGDKLSSIENLAGSLFNDRLTGDGAANELAGSFGNDTLAGGGGSDRLIGGVGSDRFVIGDAAEALTGPDTIADFNVRAPSLGGDQLDISDLVADFVGAPATLTDLVSQGFLSFVGADKNASTALTFDSDGAGAAAGATGTAVILSGVTFVDSTTALAQLEDNIVTT